MANINKLENLWHTAFKRFYCPETKLFYEYVTDDMSKAYDDLPTVYEICASYPNPCGWGTGMEDSVMNDTGVFQGYRYLNPAQSELRENVAFYPVREVGEGAILAAMCPERKVSDALAEAVLRMAEAVDVDKQSSVYPLLYMPCAYAMCVENRKNC